MMQFPAGNQQRRSLVREGFHDGLSAVNGIDFLEVQSDQRTLKVFFIHNLVTGGTAQAVYADSPQLTAENIVIIGGSRIRNLAIHSVSCFGNQLRIRLAQSGDYSTYTLKLVASPFQSEPPLGIDPQLEIGRAHV